MSLPSLSVKKPVTVLMALISIAILGFVALSKLSVDYFPNIEFPAITINTTYSGASPEEVEKSVTKIIESAVSGVNGIKYIESTSSEGSSRVTINFDWGVNLDAVTADVREKLDLARRFLPDDASTPTIFKFTASAIPIMAIAVLGSDDQEYLYNIADNTIRPKLEQVEGVAQVNMRGGLKKEIQVNVSKNRLNAYGIDIRTIAQILMVENQNIAGGYVYEGIYKFVIRTVGEFKTIEDIQNVIITVKNGIPIRIKDIADVIYQYSDTTGIVRVNGQSAISFFLTKQAGFNTVNAAKNIKKKLKEIENSLPQGIKTEIIFDNSKEIEKSISNVRDTALQGAILAIIILMLYLWNIRTVLIIAISIPASIITTFILMYFFKMTLNIISLSGLALGVGMMVDSSIVVLENIFYHRQQGKGKFTASIIGTEQVMIAITASTLTTIAVFLPIVFVQGFTAQIFRDLALTVTISLLSSLVISISIVPMLASKLTHIEEGFSFTENDLKKGVSIDEFYNKFIRDFRIENPDNDKFKTIDNFIKCEECNQYLYNFPGLPQNLKKKILKIHKVTALNKEHIYEKRYKILTLIYPEYLKPHYNILKPIERFFVNLLNLIDNIYGKILSKSLKRKKLIVSILILLSLGIAIPISIFIGKEGTTSLDEGQIEVSLTFPTGTRIEYTDKMAKEAEKQIMSLLGKNINSLMIRIDKAGGGFFSGAEYRASLRVRLIDKNLRKISQNNAIELLRKNFQNFPAIVRIRPAGTGGRFSMSSSPVSIEIKGEDLNTGSKLADTILDKISKVEGIREPKTSKDDTLPEVRLNINRNIATKLGLNAYNIAQSIKTAYGGSVVSKFRGNVGSELDILLKLKDEDRVSIDNILSLYLPTPVGKMVPLASIASVEKSYSPVSIKRKDNTRYFSVDSDIFGRPINKIMEDIKNVIQTEVFIPTGFTINYGGSYQEMQESFQQLGLALILALILVYAIMASQFESLIAPFIIMFSLPFGFAGSVLLLFITGNTLNTISLIGIIILAGIVVNNGIVLIDYMNQLMHQGLTPDKAATEAGMRRLRPISMTTLTTILAMVPMALGLGQGGELYSPMALSIIGGLTMSTIFTLIVVPLSYAAIRNRFPLKSYED